MAESPRGGIPLGEVAAVPVMNPWERLNIIGCWVKTASVPNKENRRNDAQRQLIRRNWSAFSQPSVRDLALEAVIVDKRLQPEEPPLRSNPMHSENENELQLPPIAPRRFILRMRGECVCMSCIVSTLSRLRKVTKYCLPGSRPLSCWPIDTYGYTHRHPLCASIVFLDGFITFAWVYYGWIFNKSNKQQSQKCFAQLLWAQLEMQFETRERSLVLLLRSCCQVAELLLSCQAAESHSGKHIVRIGVFIRGG